MNKERRYIIHADMDAFFAAVEQRDNPELRGKPVIVGADPKSGLGRGVVSTCSYEAREYGISSAMPISKAFRKCPHGVFIPVSMNKYQEVSIKVYNIFYDFTPHIEPISIDEAFLDVTDSFHLFDTPGKTARLIKARIKKELSLTVSVGLSLNKMLAKIASDLKKPDGLVFIMDDKELKKVIWPLSVEKIPGVGEKTKRMLSRVGINLIGDIAKFEKWDLIKMFGEQGYFLWNLAFGIDRRKVFTDRIEKSVGNEVTFDRDTLSEEKIKAVLMKLSEKVSFRLRKYNLKGNKLTLKVRFEDFVTHTKDFTLYKSTNFANILYKEVCRLYYLLRRKNNKKIRLLGVKVSGLSPADEKELIFDSKEDEEQENLHKVINKIQGKYGVDSIYRGRRVKGKGIE